MTIRASCEIPQAAEDCWDVLVVGAGIAGTACAIQLARLGLRTLLMDAKEFPRAKVCGGCLNGRSQASLSKLGLSWNRLSDATAPVEEFRLVCGNREVRWALPTTMAVGRDSLDELLVQLAIENGVHFLPSTNATVIPLDNGADAGYRSVIARHREQGEQTLRAKVVIAADGLGHPSLKRLTAFETAIKSDSRIGLQFTVASTMVSDQFPAGRLNMLVGSCGYVGVVPIDGGRTNFAAAVDRFALRASADSMNLIRKILGECNVAFPRDVEEVRIVGTPPLSQRSRACAETRLFLVGDAVGYIEPFTGEGMAWALLAAEALVPLVRTAVDDWDEAIVPQWHAVLEKQIVRNQWICRLLSKLVRHPRGLRAVMRVGAIMPPLQRLAVQRISGPPRKILSWTY